MENQQRVLAYSLATPLTEAEMDDISGGSSSMCFKPCTRISGGTGNYYVEMDVVVDGDLF